MNETTPSHSTRQPPPGAPYYYAPYNAADDEINLLDMWRVLMQYKVLIIGITLLAVAAAVAIALVMTPVYRAEALLAPIAEDEQSALSAAVSSQFGGLASLAGVNLGAGGGNTDRVIATMRSRSFVGDFIKQHQLMPVLFAKKWNAETKTWQVEQPEDVPTELEAAELFQQNILSINADKKTGLVTLAIEWQDAQLAAAWANDLVNRINNFEKRSAIKEAEQSISYLKDQLARTGIVEVQQAIYRLMEVQTKKIMLANVRDQYAFKVIDPAVAPEKRTKPKRKMIVAIGGVAGLLGGIFLAFLLSAIKRQKEMARAGEQSGQAG